MMTAPVIFIACLVLCSQVVSAGVGGHVYPNKSVRFVVPFPPGGGTDILARTLGKGLSEITGQQFVVDNRGGAGGNIGAEIVARSAPDGYTLLLGTNTMAINASLYTNLPFDTSKAFTPIALLAITPNLLMVRLSLPVNTVKQLIDFAKMQPAKLTYASQGNGGTGHLAGELFKTMAGVNLIHIPYKGASPAIIDLIAGNVDMMFVGIASLPFARSGKFNALAVTTLKRSPAAPDIPTMAESGLAGYEVTTWFGVLAPAHMPPAIVRLLNDHLRKVLAVPSVSQYLSAQGYELARGTESQFADFFKAEITKWGSVVRASGAKVD